MSRHLLVGGISLLASALTTSTALATPSTGVQLQDDWLAWHGCWQPEAALDGELLCVVPDGAGVRMITVQGKAIVAESRIIADGRSRSVRHDDCSGTEVAYWSDDGRRVFLTSELQCGQGVTRKASGVFAFTSAREWVSVQAVTIDDQTATRTVRYTAVEPTGLPVSIGNVLRSSRSARITARQFAMAPISEDDVDEAVNSIDPVAVQAWLNETNAPYQLGGDVQDVSGQVAYTSALDQVGRMSNPVVYRNREVVHVVERPVVHRTYVTHVVRSCWDPFYSGWAFGYGRVVSFGVSYGYPCGGYYYSRYSPWGYDLYGWRVVHAPVLIVRHSPIIIRRGSSYYRPVIRRDRYYDRSSGGRATRSGYTQGRSGVTRSGSSDDRQRVTTVERSDREWTTTNTRTTRNTRAVPRTQTRTRETPTTLTRTRETQATQTRTREARPATQTRSRDAQSADQTRAVRTERTEQRSQSRASGGTQRSGESGRAQGSVGGRAQSRQARSR